MSGKEPRVGAHRGGGAMVGWWRDLGVTAVDGGGSYADGSARVREMRGPSSIEEVGRRERGGGSHLGEGTTSVVWPNSR
jgi:hypothetical protein